MSMVVLCCSVFQFLILGYRFKRTTIAELDELVFQFLILGYLSFKLRVAGQCLNLSIPHFRIR